MSSTEMRRYKSSTKILHDMVMERLDRYIGKENYVETPSLSTDSEEPETKSKIEKFEETHSSSECFKCLY